MKILSADFVVSAVSAKQYPRTGYPEVAFVGRSNVGKSSLINSLLNRKKLVKTSATPGKTQTINFFNINDRMMFADLPGYGFAKVPEEVKRRWQRMVENYLQQRDTLRTVVLILDIRRDPADLDLQMQRWLEACGRDYLLVATKADKLTQTEIARQLKKLRATFADKKNVDVLAYSSKNNRGRLELWRRLQAAMEEEPPREVK